MIIIPQKLFIAAFLLFSVFTGIFLMSEIKKTEIEIGKISSAQITEIIPQQIKNRKITLIFVGDIMFDRGVEYMVEKYGQSDFKFPFLKIADYLKGADILVGNLEGPISDKGQKVGSIYSFRSNPKAVEGLNFAGFDIVSMSNNHVFDYGREAMEDAFQRLKKAGIDYVGGGFNETEAYSPRIKDIRDTKIAFLSYTNLGSEYWRAQGDKSGISWLEKERMEKEIKDAKSKADIIVVSLHYGEEYFSEPNDLQVSISRAAIDAGADLVVGHHPHVVQRIEKYKPSSEESLLLGKEGFIAYSLGNFVFDQAFSEETMTGLLLKVSISHGKITGLFPINVKINQFFQPELVK